MAPLRICRSVDARAPLMERFSSGVLGSFACGVNTETDVRGRFRDVCSNFLTLSEKNDLARSVHRLVGASECGSPTWMDFGVKLCMCRWRTV